MSNLENIRFLIHKDLSLMTSQPIFLFIGKECFEWSFEDDRFESNPRFNLDPSLLLDRYRECDRQEAYDIALMLKVKYLLLGDKNVY